MLTADNPARGRGVRSRGIAGQGSRSPDPPSQDQSDLWDWQIRWESSEVVGARTAPSQIFVISYLCCGEKRRAAALRVNYLHLQEAQLSPRDRAMRCVNWNLANCHATVQKLLIRQVLTKLIVWSWRFSRRQCVIDNVHSTMTRSSRLPLSQVS